MPTSLPELAPCARHWCVCRGRWASWTCWGRSCSWACWPEVSSWDGLEVFGVPCNSKETVTCLFPELRGPYNINIGLTKPICCHVTEFNVVFGVAWKYSQTWLQRPPLEPWNTMASLKHQRPDLIPLSTDVFLDNPLHNNHWYINFYISVMQRVF